MSDEKKDYSSRKLPDEVECPVVVLLYKMIPRLSEWFHKNNFTPNEITFISGIFGLISAYFLYKSIFGINKNYTYMILFSIFFLMYYILDIVDGYYARTYKMCSKLGDYFDHIRDVLINGLLIFILSYSFYKKRKYKYIVLLIVLFLLAVVHMGCQENYNNMSCPDKNHECYSETLNFVNVCKKKSDYIYYTRYLGIGTFIILLIILANYHHHKHK